jgi:hypothetical protein
MTLGRDLSPKRHSSKVRHAAAIHPDVATVCRCLLVSLHLFKQVAISDRNTSSLVGSRLSWAPQDA